MKGWEEEEEGGRRRNKNMEGKQKRREGRREERQGIKMRHMRGMNKGKKIKGGNGKKKVGTEGGK